jgi:hypothetical protein
MNIQTIVAALAKRDVTVSGSEVLTVISGLPTLLGWLNEHGRLYP